MTKARFESLPDEILLYMFDYIDDTRLFRAFFGLNNRFNSLFFSVGRVYRLDFESISRHDFARIFEEYISVVPDRISSIRLSNSDETPGLIEDFLRRRLPLHLFTNLRSLTFTGVSSDQLFQEIIDECRTVPCLTHLRLEPRYGRWDATNWNSLLHNADNRSPLAYRQLDSVNMRSAQSETLPGSFASLQQLVMNSAPVDSKTLLRIATTMPCLRHLAVEIKESIGRDNLPCKFESLVSFKLHANNAMYAVEQILECMPNLQNLVVESCNTYRGDLYNYLHHALGHEYTDHPMSPREPYFQHLNGNDWERIIGRHLPKLEKFQLKVQYECWTCGTKEKQVDALIQSYTSPFWIHERRWFVRCEWNVHPSSPYFCIYTLPCTFSRYSIQHHRLVSRSTAPTEPDYWFPHRTHETQFRSPSHCSAFFCNVPHLSVVLPSPIDRNQGPLSVLYRLQSLSVFISGDSTEVRSQLQQFLDRAPHLYALKISCGKLTSATMVPLQLNSYSVRSLDLQDYTQHEGWRWFNEQQCAVLSASPLGARCEMLRINVENTMDVVNLVYSMPNLRAMNVQIKNDPYRPQLDYSPKVDEDGLLDLLRGFFDSSCTIIRREEDPSQIQLWIRWKASDQMIYRICWLVRTTTASTREENIQMIHSLTFKTNRERI